jgi:S1-C subfamily serine protease
MTASALLTCLLLSVRAEIKPIDAPDFPPSTQVAAVTATVRIVNPQGPSEGSGVLVGRGGPFVYVLTAQHVVAGARQVEVQTFSERSYPRPEKSYRAAEVLAIDAGADLAVVRLATRDPLPGAVKICPPRLVPAGTDWAVLSVGCSGGAPTCVADKVQAKRRVRRPGVDAVALFWETNKESARGRSGGPLLDRRGLLLGISSGRAEGKAYFSHVDEVHAFLRRNALNWLAEEGDREKQNKK